MCGHGGVATRTRGRVYGRGRGCFAAGKGWSAAIAVLLAVLCCRVGANEAAAVAGCGMSAESAVAEPVLRWACVCNDGCCDDCAAAYCMLSAACC